MRNARNSLYHGGIPDMVQHEYNGYLATYRSAESFTDGMEWIIKHPDKKN
jgi:glycosyltransferase involved in cell wall biosynthesis